MAIIPLKGYGDIKPLKLHPCDVCHHQKPLMALQP